MSSATLDLITGSEALLRLAAFAAMLVLLAVAERLRPLRGDSRPARRQWSNTGLMLIDTALLRVAFPVLAVALAAQVQQRGGGLFGYLDWPMWLEVVLAVLAFDLLIYWQHRLLHRIPWLWRLHRVHHSDIAFDVTTAVRFHPFEIGLSMLIKLGLVVVLGPAAAAVVLFEILLSAASLFTHADVALPRRIEFAVRAVLVTPTMHRTHHSMLRQETNSNYGFLLSAWDRLFRSYRDNPAGDEKSMPLGLPQWRQSAALGLGTLLVQPFRSEPAIDDVPRPPAVPSRTAKDPPHA